MSLLRGMAAGTGTEVPEGRRREQAAGKPGIESWGLWLEAISHRGFAIQDEWHLCVKH